MRRKFWAIKADQRLQTVSGLVSSCVCTPVLSVPELLGSGASFVRPIGCLRCLGWHFWLPSPEGFLGCGEEGNYCRCGRLGLGLMPAPVQLAGEVKSCSWFYLLLLSAMRTGWDAAVPALAWKSSTFPCYAFPVGLFSFSVGLIIVAADKVLLKLRKASWCS